MVARRLFPDHVTSCVVLQACALDDRNGFAKALLFWKSFRTQFPDAHLHSKQYVMLVRAAASGGVERPELIMPLLLPKQHEVVGPIDETVACLDGFDLPMSVKRPLLTQLERQASRQDQLKIAVASQKKLDNGKSRQNVDESTENETITPTETNPVIISTKFLFQILSIKAATVDKLH